MGNVSIRNERFSKYLRYKLNKDKVEVDDLYTITEMCLNKNDFNNEVTDFEIDGIRYFRSLNELYVKNFKVTNEFLRELARLKKLKKLVFFCCEFDKNIKIKNKLEKLEVLKCINIFNIKVVNTSNIKISYSDVDFKFLKILNNVKNIVLLNTFIGFNLGNDNLNRKNIINLKKNINIKIIDSKINENILFKFKMLENIIFVNTKIIEDLKLYIEKNDRKKKINLNTREEYMEFTKEKGDIDV